VHAHRVPRFSRPRPRDRGRRRRPEARSAARERVELHVHDPRFGYESPLRLRRSSSSRR
jgi:hypothetical protein